MLSVLFAILFQSLHSYEHFSHGELAVHHLDSHDQDLHQNGHNHEKCFVCEFTFNNFIGTAFTAFSFKNSFELIVYNFFYSEKPFLFNGGPSSLRGPPVSIC